MTTIVQKPLPHARIPYEQMSSIELKRAVMLLNDNIATLQSQLETAQKAIVELQRRK